MHWQWWAQHSHIFCMNDVDDPARCLVKLLSLAQQAQNTSQSISKVFMNISTNPFATQQRKLHHHHLFPSYPDVWCKMQIYSLFEKVILNPFDYSAWLYRRHSLLQRNKQQPFSSIQPFFHTFFLLPTSSNVTTSLAIFRI